MKKWIKVNEYYRGDGPTRLTYINVKKIAAFWENEERTTIYFNRNDLIRVKETPEEILKLMERNKKK
jgi:hypothetical protein